MLEAGTQKSGMGRRSLNSTASSRLNLSQSPTNSSASATSVATSATSTTAPKLLSYPYYPTVKDPHNQIAGYLLNNTGYEDTDAVLAIMQSDNTTVRNQRRKYLNRQRNSLLVIVSGVLRHAL